MWKKKNYESDMFGKSTPITAAILNDGERKVPRLGGLVIIFATLFTVYIYYFFSLFFFQNDIMQKLNFLSRSQT